MVRVIANTTLLYKYTPINTTTDSFVQKYLTGPNIQTLQPNLQLSPVVQASPPPLAIVQDLGLDLSKVSKKSNKAYNIMDKLASCKKFSGYPKDNGFKFMKEFESFATLHELDEDVPENFTFILKGLRSPGTMDLVLVLTGIQ